MTKQSAVYQADLIRIQRFRENSLEMNERK